MLCYVMKDKRLLIKYQVLKNLHCEKSKPYSRYSNGAVGAYLGATAGGVIVSTIVGVKMTIKVDEAKEERARNTL